MKHHFAPWSTVRPNTGLAKLAILEGESHSHCTHCGIVVKYPEGLSTMRYWVGGHWNSQRPPCEKSDKPPPPSFLDEWTAVISTMGRKPPV